MIEVHELVKKYSGVTVLDLQKLSIAKGEIFGLVGNNGAGKTTFFNLVLDLIVATKGTVKINDIDVQKSEAWKPLTSAFIDETYLIGYLTPEEYFYFIGNLRGIKKETIDSWLPSFESFFNGEILNQKKYIRDLSKGNQKKVGIVGTLIGQPELILLDEPFSNLDPSSQIKLKTLLKKTTTESQTTFLISSHDLTHVTEICQRIVLLEKGVIQKDIHTAPSTLRELEAYFSKSL